MNNPKFGYTKLACGHVVDQDAEDDPCQECAENPPEEFCRFEQAKASTLDDIFDEVEAVRRYNAYPETRAAAEQLAAALRGTLPRLYDTDSTARKVLNAAHAALAQWKGVGK